MNWKCISPTGAKFTRFGEDPNYKEGLYNLEHNIYAWMVPNGSWGESNAGLVVGHGESLLIDTLWDVNHTRTMLQAMSSFIKGNPLKNVVNTHADGDHFWGNELVSDIEIITSKTSYHEMLHTQPRTMLFLKRIGKFLSMIRICKNDKVGHWFQGMTEPYAFKAVKHTPATKTFEGELTITVGGREVQLIEVGPAHTSGDLVVYVPDAKTVFSGDIICIESTPIMWAGPLENWFKALDRIMELDVEIIIPGHGPITDKSGVEAVRKYWKFVDKQVRQHFQGGMSATKTAWDIVQSNEFMHQQFSKWNSPERIMINVHTLYRHLQGSKHRSNAYELLKIFRRQALLAHELPNAQPISMQKNIGLSYRNNISGQE
jgi:cyclase